MRPCYSYTSAWRAYRSLARFALALVCLTVALAVVAALGVASLYSARQRYENTLVRSSSLATAAANVQSAAIAAQEVLREVRGPGATTARAQAAAAYRTAAATATSLARGDPDSERLLRAQIAAGPTITAAGLATALETRQRARQAAARRRRPFGHAHGGSARSDRRSAGASGRACADHVAGAVAAAPARRARGGDARARGGRSGPAREAVRAAGAARARRCLQRDGRGPARRPAAHRAGAPPPGGDDREPRRRADRHRARIRHDRGGQPERRAARARAHGRGDRRLPRQSAAPARRGAQQARRSSSTGAARLR